MSYQDIDAPTSDDTDQQILLLDLGLFDDQAAPSFGRLAQLVIAALRAPAALLTIVERDRQIILSSAGAPGPQAPAELPQPLQLGQQIVASCAPLAIADAGGHTAAQADGAKLGLVIGAYIGAPLRAPDGQAIGAICAIDTAPRAWSEDDMATLQNLAAIAATEIELRRALAASRRREAELGAAEARVRALSVLTSDYVYSVHLTAEGQMVSEWMTGAFTRITGYTTEELGRQGLWAQLFHPDDLPLVHGMISAARAGHSYVQEFRIVTKAGATRWLREYGQPEWDAQEGRVVRILGAAQDITEWKHADEAVRTSEAELRALFAALPDIILVLDAQGYYRRIGPNNPDLLYRPAPELIGKRLHEVFPAAQADEFLTRIQQSLGSQQTIAYTYSLTIGTTQHWFSSTIAPMDADTVVMIARDITAQHQAEAALRESEERYRLITEHTSDLISLFDQQGRYIYASPSHLQMAGYDPAALIGMRAIDFIHPEDQDTLTELWRTQLHTQRRAHVTFRYRHADGSWRWCDATMATIDHPHPRYIIGTARDVTDRKRLEAQLQHAQKMESIGRLAGGVAHDFNNLLAAIIGYADLVEEALPPDTSARNDMGEIQKAARRAANLTRQLLAFARRQIFAPQVLNLSDLILDMDKLLRRLIGEDIELITIPSPDLLPIKADPGQIEQVLANLVVNARDAMPEGGKLLIETSNIVLDASYSHEHIGVAPGPYVLLSVSDTGIGMTEDVKRHLFEPFFTTKEPGKGTGLGLATCYGIVKQHGGNIWAYSEIGQGTSIKVYLPCAPGGASAIAMREAEGLLPRGTETVLLVEDEAAVRTLNARVLRTHGYHVIEAANGAEALRIARSSEGPPIQLLLTDVVMPQMGGVALAEQLIAIHPSSKVLYTSGYTEHLAIQQSPAGIVAAFIQKPVAPAVLVRKVREVLDG